MARIQVTGFIDTDDLGFDDIDLGHPMGVSDQFYAQNASAMRIALADGSTIGLDDIEFELVDQ